MFKSNKIVTVGTIPEFLCQKNARSVVQPRKEYGNIIKKVATTVAIPFVLTPHAFAQSTQTASVSGYIGEKSLNIIAHALDPLVELMVALSFPIASVIMVGSCFFFMFGNNEKAWSGIMKAGLGYVLIQLSPLFLKIMKEVGTAII